MLTDTAIQTAISTVKGNIISRVNKFSINVQTSLLDGGALARFIVSQCCAVNEYNAGQYIWYHLQQIDYSCTFSGGYATINFCLDYYTDSAQETAAVAEAQNVITNEGLQVLTTDTDAQVAKKVKKLYTWITEHCTYDKVDRRTIQLHNLIDDTTTSVSVIRNAMWDCLISDQGLGKKKAVCQSISNTLYYILNKVGIPTMIVQGYEVNPKNELFHHVWNLCEIGGKWYNVDATAALHCADGVPGYAECDMYSWLLCGSSDFTAGPNRYVRLPAFYSNRFNTAHEVANTRFMV
ncbi:MAG: hypothetical protein J5379_03495 [Clostridiales bacterium]|nr:hypothetical protein [Clostridiales bacterium]